MMNLTFKRMTSLLLAFAMIISAIGIDTSKLYASASETAEKIEITEIDTTTVDYPIMLRNRINTARLTKIGLYSKLTDEEKRAVCEYYALTDSAFVAAEKAGYNILDSARIIKAANAAEITPAEYKEYVESYGSEEEASFQLQGYSLYEDKIADKYKSEFKDFMKKGYDVFKLHNTYNVAEYIGTSISSIVPENAEIQIKDNASDFEKYAESYFCDAEKLEAVTVKKGISKSELIATSSGIKKEIKETELVSEPAEASELTAASTSSDDTQSSYLQANKHEFIASPSQYYAEQNELVSGTSGELSYRENVFDLKGINGVDVDLDIIFIPNSNMYYGKLSEDVNFDWYNYNEVDKEPFNSALGVGWTFNLPKFSENYEKESFDEDAESIYVTRYHPREGGSYKVVQDDDEDPATMTLEDYPREDISVLKINTGTSRYRITFANGDYQIIDKYGRMTEEGDRFGNKITYEYYLGYGTFYEGGLKKITDALGRKIEIVYQMNPSGRTDCLVNVVFDGNEVAQFSLVAENSSEPYLLYRMHTGPGLTIFTYACDDNGNIGNEFVCTDQPYFSPIITTMDSMNTVLNIEAMTYNTGLTSHYLFEEVDVNNGVGGVKRILRVKERYESKTSDAVSDPDDVLRLTEYEYNGDYSGYSRRIMAPETNMELYADPNDLPETFTYKVSKIQNGIETKTTYNNEHLPIKVETIVRGETVADDVEYAHEDITYDQYELPIKREKYVGEYIESTEQFEYDSKGNLIKSWSTYADGEKNNEYATLYTYDSTYNLPLTVTYKRDADTTVTETYTLSEDKKTVTKKEITENDALKERTAYTYDTYGNIIKERKYKNATQYIDVNYDYTDTTGADRPNNTSFNGAYLTKIWQNGGNDIDGNAIGNVEYKYEYDNSGNRIKETDPLGNTTQYQYDDFRRITKITNPSGGIQTLSYTVNTTANTTTHTDELGTQTKYIYDPANNLTDVLDVTSGESLESYDYDKWYRKIKERNVQLLTSGFETTYAYDSLNRVTSKETKDYYDVTVAKENYAYDDGVASAYLLTTHTIVGDSFAPSIVTKEYVNAYGDVEKIGYVTGNNEYFTTYKYDYLGTKTEELAAIADQKDWTNTFTSKWEYDYAGRVLREYDASNNFISYEYDWLGRPIKAYDRVSNASANPYYTSYTYDNLGNVIQETIPQTETTNKVTKYKYDKLGNLTLEKKLYDIVDGEEIYHSTSYSYDWRGNVTTATQDIYPTTYTYDALGRCLTSTTGGKTTTYTYDRFGNVLTETFGGKTDTYEYDMNMFRTKHIYPSEKRITYEPNALQKTYAIMSSEESGGRTFEYTMTGTLLQASDASYIGRIRRKYDDRGNIIEEENTGMTKTYTYDISGKRESMLAKSGSTTVQDLRYVYNNLEQMIAIGEGNSPFTMVDYQYDANGNVLYEHKYMATELLHNYNHDGTRNGTLETNDTDATDVVNRTYTYYLNGNLKTEQTVGGETKTYTYNSRNMLETENVSSGKTISYSYDSGGNQTQKNEIYEDTLRVSSYQFDSMNRLIQKNVVEYMADIDIPLDVIYYTYDDDGRLIRRCYYDEDPELALWVDTFGYNGYGEMTQSVVNGVTTNYTYYADGLRRTKTSNGITTVHMLDGDDVIADLNGSYELKYSYVRGLGNQLEVFEVGSEGSGLTSAYIHNIHGDVEELAIAEIGMGCAEYRYDAYGNHTAYSGEENPFRYSGEYYDEETGFIYLRARYYDPTIGRFISENPIRDGLNWYAYCNNNPVMYVDPSGTTWTYYDSMLPDWAQDKLEQLTSEYYAAGDSKDEYGEYVRTAIHNEAFAIRMLFLEQKWINYALLDFQDVGITRENYVNLIYEEGMSYEQMFYQYALALQIEGDDSVWSVKRGLDGHLTEFFLNSISRGHILSALINSVVGSPKPSLKTMNNEAANKLAQEMGFTDAHEFKKEFVGKKGSNYNMKIDKKTGEIFLEPIKKGGEIIGTGYYK